MSNNCKDLKQLIDLAIAKGMFRTSEAVVQMQHMYEYFVSIEGEHQELSHLLLQARKELKDCKEYNSERSMPSKSSQGNMVSELPPQNGVIKT